MRFIHCSDIHLGKTYRSVFAEKQRYEDFFQMLSGIVADAVDKQVDFMLIGGDLFHVGQILPKTFARTIETLQPLKDAGIPCIAIEGNHDWVHRRDNVSWMEALSQLGYICLLRPQRTEEGGYHFAPFDVEEGCGGHLQIGDLNIYGVGYIGAQAGNHVERICKAVETQNNLLLFHVGVWTYSPVEIGNMKPEEAHPLAETFSYVALGHGHKPYVVETPAGNGYAYNPGSPERVNFGEQKYDKGYYLVEVEDGGFTPAFIPTDPRPMHVEKVDLDGTTNAAEALQRVVEQVTALLADNEDSRQPLLELKLTGRVKFHPFELGRERLQAALADFANPLHLEVKNQLSLHTKSASADDEKKSLSEIEEDVLHELISADSHYQGQEDELCKLALRLRDAVQQGVNDGDELLALLEGDR
ncbi:DNA repair exonuclease SbcCD nuclease subunit [Malonomonas rubra DSM 5091]|uniref:DNA repair exonuclease SbcCD nuclease subunit n=1 Tax=Malonomonas rubra DSM 5091 TaxID=1122189 RepID=A0A1M6DHW3_MALRU|nr:exonuclease SbcCD subunit D [Malonomonas rubra]SHI72894.1 DNA repair exonuclease SbcCD nuclease subunit [Malonomonas rubra DSM 5091]